MNVWHCTKCHHEWELHTQRDCDWCGAPSKLIATKRDVPLQPLVDAIGADYERRARLRKLN